MGNVARTWQTRIHITKIDSLMYESKIILRQIEITCEIKNCSLVNKWLHQNTYIYSKLTFSNYWLHVET